MGMSNPRTLVRCLVGTALILSLAGSALPSDPAALPAIALGQPVLYRLEVALAVFYGCLLIFTPAYSGLIAGRLPIEISTRGARFSEYTDHAVEGDATTTRDTQVDIAHLESNLAAMQVEIDLLNNEGDNA